MDRDPGSDSGVGETEMEESWLVFSGRTDWDGGFKKFEFDRLNWPTLIV
jgi:hypothetical protein